MVHLLAQMVMKMLLIILGQEQVLVVIVKLMLTVVLFYKDIALLNLYNKVVEILKAKILLLQICGRIQAISV
jgi:hypothetical protein